MDWDLNRQFPKEEIKKKCFKMIAKMFTVPSIQENAIQNNTDIPSNTSQNSKVQQNK